MMSNVVRTKKKSCTSEVRPCVLIVEDGRKKRRAKRLCATNVTGLLLACFGGNSLNINVLCSSIKRCLKEQLPAQSAG